MAMLGFAIRHIPGIDRSQVLLLPEAVDDCVGRDNPVRFIDAFVDGLDLAAAGFERAAPKATGRPGYDPADLLKLYICGYLNRVRSSRRLEAESKRNLEVIWLLRGLSPDFKTIADFRRINRAAFHQVFREFVKLCRELDLFGRALVAVDGTRIKAVNSRERNFTKAKLKKALADSDERLSRYLDRLDEADGQDGGGTGGGEVENIQEKIAAIQGRRERFEEHRDALAASGEDQLSLTDPDSRAMYAATRVGVGYNIQIAVDAKHKLIAEQQVHNKVSDLGLLAETAVAARRKPGPDRDRNDLQRQQDREPVPDSIRHPGQATTRCGSGGWRRGSARVSRSSATASHRRLRLPSACPMSGGNTAWAGGWCAASAHRAEAGWNSSSTRSAARVHPTVTLRQSTQSASARHRGSRQRPPDAPSCFRFRLTATPIWIEVASAPASAPPETSISQGVVNSLDIVCRREGWIVSRRVV